MHYYAIINEEYVVMEVTSSTTVINNPSYIEINEEQYNDEGFIGYFYDQDKNEFVGYVMWMCTSNEIRYDETYRTLTGKLNEMDEEIATHTHTGYASSDDLQVLEDVVDTKADANHTHSGYALTNHGHTEYALQTSLDTLGEEVREKADANHSHSEYSLSSHEHTDYAEVSHNHDSDYAPISHSHSNYVTTTDFEALESEVDGKASSTHTHTAAEIGAATSGHNHDSEYSSVNHNHDEDYAPLSHTHSNYATTTSVNELSATVSGKANASHTHDDRYYTETEIDTKLAAKSDSSHTHAGVYDVNGAAASALSSANTYTDSKIDALVGEGASVTLDTIGEISAVIEDNQDAIDLLNAAIGSKANNTDLNSHTSNTDIHITDAERDIWNAKSNFSGNYNDLTNKPSIPSINGLATEIYVDEKVGAITVESIGALPNTTVIPTVPTNVSAFANDVGYLTEHQSLNGLATEVYVDTQINAIDIPSALSDLTTDSTHRVVTDAEKASWNAKSNFSGNYNDLTNKPSIPSISGLATEAYVDEAVSTKANSSHTHTIANVSGLQSALDSKSASTHNHNSAYDVLGAASSALTSAKDYTDDAIADEVIARDAAIATAKSSAISTASSDATTKANNALASAKTYTDSAVATVKNDLLNGAGTAYDTLKELGDLIDDNVDAIEALEAVAAGKANASHTHTIANITNLQSTLDGKAASSHTHSYAGSSSTGGAATSANKLNTNAGDSNTPVYFANGVPVACTSLDLNTTGNAATATNVAWSGVTSKPSYYDAKAIKSITRNGTTFTYTCMDGTTGTFTQQDNNTTYGVVTTSANGLMIASDKSKLDGMVLATVSEVETYLGI